MKNKFLNIKYIAFILSVFFMVSCDTILDQDETDFGNGPILAQFEKSNITANFITDGTVQTYNIPIRIVGGKNEPISTPVDVTISVNPSSTATSGVQYSLDKTAYTIQPGDMFVNAQISVDTDNLDPFDAKTLVLQIDSSSQGVSESNKTNIVLQAVCELEMDNFVGEYTNDKNQTVTVTLGSKPNSLLIKGGNGGTDEILAVLNDDVTDPTITYVEGGEAVFGVHATYGDIWAATIEPESSSYNSCDYGLNLTFKRCVGVGCFAGEIEINLVKKN